MEAEAVATNALDETRPLRKNRDFTLLWGGQAISQLGSAVSVLAFPLLVLSLNGSAVQAGALGTLQAVIRVAFQLPAGVLADRGSRKRVMQVCDAARAGLFLILAAAVLLDRAPLAVIFLIAGVTAILDVLFSAAEKSIVSQLVPKDQLPEAFATNEARMYGASLTGPPLGGLLYALGRSIPFLFDVLSYALSFLAISFIRKPASPHEVETTKTSMREDVMEGLRHVSGSPFLRAVIFLAAPINFALSAVQFSIILILTDAGHSSRVVGIAQGCIAVGGLIGAFLAARIQKLVPFHRLIIITLALLLVLLLGSALLAGEIAMVVPVTLGLFLAPAVNSALFGKIASVTAARIQGRVISVVVLSAMAAASLAPVIAGLVVELGGGVQAMGTALVATAASLLAAIVCRRTLRTV
ncbi:MFS transporter (plasmid) [Streptomyces sp. NBC_00868]|uniref:MFS transporter n=1 Tax=Streptomyces sp. NBC_00868 TaxID=2903683 RepID=UPI002F915E94|nr:MFS transporter [Streptomyces sp. NBC_00868]